MSNPSRFLALAAVLALLAWVGNNSPSAQKPAPDAKAEYAAKVQPILKKYCLDCHSTKAQKGHLDLERFTSTDDIRKDLKPWQSMIEQIETGEMPPKNKPQLTADEKKQLLAWIQGFLEHEAKSRSGDPGFVPLRRLSNAEYNYTIRDLTGVDLQPTREFPADGAAGEGFTNAAEALTDISPALFTKYLNAAKDISERAVLLPDGFRFSMSKTRRDWTDESLKQLRAFFAPFANADGKVNFVPYLSAVVRHRDAILANKTTIADVAAAEKLNAKYLGILWVALTDKTPSYPLDAIRAKFRTATEKDVPALAADVAAWQTALWKVVAIGSYRNGTSRQSVFDPPALESQQIKLPVKVAPGQSDVVLYLVARDQSPDAKGNVIWNRPRFEGAGKPALLLSDYATFGSAFETDYPSVFANSSKYLAAVVEAVNDKKLSVEDIAKKHGLDATFLSRWIAVLGVEPFRKEATPEIAGRVVPVIPLTLMEEKTPPVDGFAAIKGWRKKGTELPMLVTNASDKNEQIPGRVSARGVAMHPMPKEFVAVVWKSPIAGSVKVNAKIVHSHPNCGNGVAWWLEHRRGDKATVIGEGEIALGAAADPAAKTLKVEKGDSLILAVDAKEENHFCDMTEVSFTVTEIEKPTQVWELAADIANTISDGNPHADKHGNKDTWSFAFGPSRPLGKAATTLIPATSVLGKWREVASDPLRQADAAKLAEQVQTLLSGTRPAQEKSPDRVLYDTLVSGESPLFQGINPASFGKPRPKDVTYGLPKELFGKHPDMSIDAASLVLGVNTVTEVHLPASLFQGREFVVDGKLDVVGNRLVQFSVHTAPPTHAVWDAKGVLVGLASSEPYRRLLSGYNDFRRLFPLYVCFPAIVPTDEVVSLKMFHREDEPLTRLFLSDSEQKQLEHLWAEHRFISRQPVAENDYLPQFIGYVTQDQPKETLAYFEGLRPEFKRRADEFEKELETAIPKQLDAVLAFAEKAYRRPLIDKEKAELHALYKAIRGKGAGHEEAFRGVLSRVFVSPAFLFRIEQAPAGIAPGNVNDWELATRLSYFLWASAPDEELRKLAAAGQLRDPKVLEAQSQRMLKDARLRALAIEFGTQWLHVRGFDDLKEKNEKLFPTFDAKLRAAIYEESILFFQDLFQSDRTASQILDADYTFLNDTLAKHYGIPGVNGQEFRRVDGVKKFGRGGVLGLASVQTKEAGASRTSPVLRGNWVVETLLGEKLPEPPANVPQLPEEEGGADKLTMRQQVEKHTRVESCAVCHVRIDPFGFALEKYDPIGRLREKDLGGLPVDAKSKLKDGTEFEGIDGLRTYLLTKKKDVVTRLFCKRLLGYALGRAVTLSDTALLDEMVAALNKNEGRVSAAVRTIVTSPQFRTVRGSEFTE